MEIWSLLILGQHGMAILAIWQGQFIVVQASSPSKEQINVYSAVYYGLQAGINEMRPGKTNKDGKCTHK